MQSIWLDKWYCLDCKRVVMLNAHGRCERCDSDAVTWPESGKKEALSERTTTTYGLLA